MFVRLAYIYMYVYMYVISTSYMMIFNVYRTDIKQLKLKIVNIHSIACFVCISNTLFLCYIFNSTHFKHTF